MPTTELRAWAATKPEIRRLWIFGSALTGKPNPSDLDIAFDAGIPESDLLSAVAQWEREIAPWCPYPPSLQSIGTLLKRDPARPSTDETVWDVVKREGKLVYDVERTAWLQTIIDAIERNEARKRKHADFYEWDDKPTKEAGIAAYFCEELARTHGIAYSLAPESEIAGKPNDPPDVVLKDASGSLVGLEVTELVNRAAIDAQIARRRDYEKISLSFDRHDAVELLHERVIRKERDAVKVAAQFADYLLLFHCAEPWLSREKLANEIAAHTWPPTRGIRAAYLMFDYEPPDRRPVVRLF